jgi:high-affinity nickel permease
VLAISFGPRHAIDADRVVAIDHVTLKVMQGGKRVVGGSATLT